MKNKPKFDKIGDCEQLEDNQAGYNFESVAEKARQASWWKNKVIRFNFNGVECYVDNRNSLGYSATTNLEFLMRDYLNAHIMDWKEVGPYCDEKYPNKIQKELEKREVEAEKRRAESKRQYKLEQEEKEKSLEEKIGEIEMEFSNKELWESGLEKNQDPYGGGVYSYAKYWARLMQYEMSQKSESKKFGESGVLLETKMVNPTLSDIAQQASYDADVEGITGFMYGAAVSILSNTWKYGEELRKWHNKDYGHEGDGVVNPAILTLKTKDE